MQQPQASHEAATVYGCVDKRLGSPTCLCDLLPLALVKSWYRWFFATSPQPQPHPSHPSPHLVSSRLRSHIHLISISSSTPQTSPSPSPHDQRTFQVPCSRHSLLQVNRAPAQFGFVYQGSFTSQRRPHDPFIVDPVVASLHLA